MMATSRGGRAAQRSTLITLAALAAILLATLRPGDPAALQPTPLTCLACGTFGLIDVWRNVVLFLPLGVGLALLGLRPLRAAALALALSLTVETIQLTVLAGRAASLSDLVTNTTGAATGALLVHHWRAWITPTAVSARRLAAAAALAWTAALALTGAGLRWAESATPYRVNQLPPTEGTMRAFEGIIHEATLDGAPVTTGTRGGSVLPHQEGDTLRLRARVTPSYPPGMLRPIVWAFSEDWAEVLVFGQRGRALVVRLRTRSADARLASPTFILPDAFTDGNRPVELRAEVTRNALTLTSVLPDDERVARFAKRLSLGWMLVMPQGTTVGRPALASAAWMALLVLPMAYWGALGARPREWRRGSLTALAAVAGMAVAAPILLGAIYGLSPLGMADWCGVVAGIAAGWGAARASLLRSSRL